jgi:hypothetical protein
LKLLLRVALPMLGVVLVVFLVLGGGQLPVFEALAEPELRRASPGAPSPAERLVVLISIDGLAPWVLEQTAVPTLARLAREGTRAREARTVQPSITLTSHMSMLSGVGPEVHGVLWNRYEPWHEIRVPTIYSVCRETGLRCGLFAGKTKFVHFAEKEPGVLIYHYAPDQNDVFETARKAIQDEALDFALVHLAEVDRTGHEQGWGSEAQREQLAAIDASLGRFVAALEAVGRPFTLIVTADHGGFELHHTEDRPENWRIPWLAYGDTVRAGGVLAEVSTLDTAPTILKLLGRPVPETMEGRARLR